MYYYILYGTLGRGGVVGVINNNNYINSNLEATIM